MSQFIVKQTEGKYDAIKELQNAHLDASFTIGAEASNIIKVTVQFKSDKAQTSSTTRKSVFAYLSDDANGDTIVGTAPDGGWAIATNGVLMPVVTSKAAHLVSEATGIVDINITHAAGAK